MVSKIGEIQYGFTVGKKRIKKTVHHYLLRHTGGKLSANNDPTGEVVEVRWFDLSQLEDVLAHATEKRIAGEGSEADSVKAGLASGASAFAHP